jgi:heat shock protein HslJ
MQFKNSELAGFAGCNSYKGTFTATPNDDGTFTIAIGPVTTSRLNCPQEIMEQETTYLTILQQANLAAIQQNSITVSSPTGSLIFYLIEGD